MNNILKIPCCIKNESTIHINPISEFWTVNITWVLYLEWHTYQSITTTLLPIAALAGMNAIYANIGRTISDYFASCFLVSIQGPKKQQLAMGLITDVTTCKVKNRERSVQL